MGMLNIFTRPQAQLRSLPKGSFTVDREGRILVSTLPQAFPAALAENIAARVLSAFRSGPGRLSAAVGSRRPLFQFKTHGPGVARWRDHISGAANPRQSARLTLFPIPLMQQKEMIQLIQQLENYTEQAGSSSSISSMSPAPNDLETRREGQFLR